MGQGHLLDQGHDQHLQDLDLPGACLDLQLGAQAPVPPALLAVLILTLYIHPAWVRGHPAGQGHIAGQGHPVIHGLPANPGHLAGQGLGVLGQELIAKGMMQR